MACINPNSPEFKSALQRTGNPLLAEIEVDKSQLEIKPGVTELFESKRSFADYSDFGKTLSEQEIINLKKEGNKVTAKQFLESIIPVNDFEKKLKSFLLSIDLNKLNGFDFVINDKYQGNIIGLNERDLFEKPTVIFNSKSTTQPSRYKLHEFLHSLLDTVINEEQEFRTELISLFDYVKTLPEFKNEYGVIGWWEFYTEGMTNPDFQAKLKNVTLSGYKGGKKSNVYEEFVKIINNILEKLGFVNKDYSALDEIINATTKVIEKRYGYSVKPGVAEQLEFHVNTLNVVSQFLEGVGVSQRLVPEFLSSDGTVIEGALAAANFLKGTVDIIDDLNKGRAEAWNKLPEEAAHWWYRLLKNSSPLKKALWESHTTALKNDELYKTNYGKNVKSPSDLTEESIGQLIAEAIKRIETKNGNASDYSFFQKFLEWINSLLQMFKEIEQDPFEVAAMKILSSDMSDIMTWEEYRSINKIVNFADILTEQSVAPIDYTLLSDISELKQDRIYDEETNQEVDVLYFADSPYFTNKEELDLWTIKKYGDILQKKQKEKIQDVKDTEMFFNRLLNKTFKKRSKFLNKTLKKYYTIVDASNLLELKEWSLSTDMLKITKNLSDLEKEQITLTNGYTNITPTLKILPDFLKKYGRKTSPEIIKQELEITNKLINKEITKEKAAELRQKIENKKKGIPIVLSEPIKIDGAKKQELSILNNIKELIKIENPDLKTITAEEFVAEVHNWLQVNYLLGFANELNHLTYRIGATFDKGGDLSDIKHNKISIRFNDQYHITKNRPTPFNNSHFSYAPSAWGNLTYFYTGNSQEKDAVLLHEIQNDNIEYLRDYNNKDVDIDSYLNDYLHKLNDDLIGNIQKLETGGKEAFKTGYEISNPLSGSPFLNILLDRVKNMDLENGLIEFKEKINEQINLYKSDTSLHLDVVNKNIEKAYSKRRIFQNFIQRGGLKSLLSEEEINELENSINYANNLSFIEESSVLSLKKEEFTRKTQHITNKLNVKLKEIYGENAPEISLFAPAKPLPKSQRLNLRVNQGTVRERVIGNASTELNTSVKFLIMFSEKQILNKLSRDIESVKQLYIPARNKTENYKFNQKLSKISLEQFSTLISNYKFNEDLLNQLVDENIKKELEQTTSLEERKKLYYNKIETLTDTEGNIFFIISGEYDKQGLPIEFYSREEVEKYIEDKLNTPLQISKQKETFEALKEKALAKKAELDEDYKRTQEKIKDVLAVEMNYFTPLIHHIIQKHINEYGRDIPMYFSGYNITQITQGSSRTALIYAGKDEIDLVDKNAFTFNNEDFYTVKNTTKFYKGSELISQQEYDKAYQQATEKKAIDIKYLAAVELNIVEGFDQLGKTEKEYEDYKKEAIKALNEFKKIPKNDPRSRSTYTSNADLVTQTIMQINNNKPIETGAIYNAMTQVSGIKLIWKDKIDGIIGTPGGYLVDLSNYNYNVPILYGLKKSTKKAKSIGEESNLQYQFKAVANIYDNLDRVNKLWKQLGDTSTFWNKIQQDFQIPKDQINLLKESEGNSIEEKLASFAANYSYTVEINTAKIKESNDYIKALGSRVSSLTQERGKYYYTDERDVKIEIDKDSWEEAKKEFDLIDKTERTTQYYSNLTVPGGTNYTENAIRIPGVVNVISAKGGYHDDQFNQSRGDMAGWFRSDEQIQGKTDDSGVYFEPEELGIPNIKTRRILEVQSFFQKVRDKESLISSTKNILQDEFSVSQEPDNSWSVIRNNPFEVIKSKLNSKEEAKKEILNITNKNKQNQFLQLLNKDNNWVTFFVKSIIQDSAKKGYEKVLFPRLDTIIQIESAGSYKSYTDAEKAMKDENWYKKDKELKEKLEETRKELKNKKEEVAKIKSNPNYDKTLDYDTPIQNLERLVSQAYEKWHAIQPTLLNTAKFYENDITNILNKQYGKENVKQVTDEYGNTWNEIEIKEENKQEIYLQKESQSTEKPSENIDNKIKSFLASIGVNIKVVQDLTDNKGNKLSGIAVADMLNKIIQVVDGKADITTLPEEAAHFFVEMLGESNPLYKEMFDKITSYKIYSETVDQYRNNKAYKNADGTLNINKLKKEAIAKLIMTHIIKNEKNNENADKIKAAESWWSKFWKWITNIFKQNTTNPFEVAAQKIMTADISDLNLNLTQDELFFQEEPTSFLNKVIADQSIITLDDSIDPKTGEKKHVYQENKKPIVDKNGNPKSVTNNVVDPWYKARFPLDTRSERKKVIDDFAAERGTDVHTDLQNIVQRYFDKNGNPRATVLPKTDIKTNAEVYNKLEKYILSLIDEFKDRPGTRFLPEVKIYSRKRNLPGTIDLLIVEPNGTTHIYDWKSQQIEKDQNDLKWFKPEAYRIQLGEYKKILMEEYGIFKFGKIRAVPIRTIFKIVNVNGQLKPVALENVEIEYDINNIPKDKDYLLPVVMLDESTGDKKLDSLLAKLNAVYDKISQGTVTESEKPFKAEELNLLKKTVRDLHVRKDMSTFIQNGLFEINKYRNKINDGTFNVNDVKESILILNVYAEGTVFLEELLKDIKNQIKTKSDPDVIEYLKNLQEDAAKMSLNAKALLVDIVGIKGDKNPTGVVAKIANEFAKEEGITTLLNPETELDWLGKMFRSLSTLQTAALQLFYKILRRAQGIRNVKITELNNKLQTLRKNLEDWGKTKGLKGEDIFNPILDIDSKGNWNGDFVKIYSQEYFKLRDEALKNEDINWIKLNTDFDKEQYEKDLKLLQQNLDERYPGNDEYVVKRKQSILNDWVLKHSDSGRLSYLNKKNYYIKPKEKWQSEKYKFIFKKDSSGKYINQPLVDTYNFFQELIKHSSEIGMLDKYSSRFIPSVYKNKITEIIGSSFKNIFDIQGAFNSLAVDADGGFGNIDPLTGVLKKQLPVYFKKDLGVQREDGTVDYSNKSKDLFSVFSIWGQQMYNYEAMDSIREKSEVLLMNEQNKSRLETNIFGTVKQDKSTIAENTKNAEILEDFINFYVYGQAKGAQIDKSVKVGGKSYSLKKATQAVIKLSTFKALALNPLSGTATFVGGTGNALFAASKKLLFTESDWVHGCKDFTSNNEITAAGLDFFDFGLDDRQKNDVRNLSANWKKRNLKWDHLMFMQRYGDIWATYPVAAAMLRTHMFDGKNIVSIRDYVKKQNDYDNFYNLSESERKRVQKKIDKEIEELQKTKSLKAVGKIENGQFVIPGLEKTSDAAINFKAKVQKTLKSIIGNSTRDDINLIRMGLLGQVLMQFRSWMPQLMTERFGEMSKNVDLDTWEYGKTRLFLKHIVDGRVLPLMKEMILGFGNNTIEKAKQRYKEFVLRLMESGKISSVEEFMTEAEFIDMYIGNLRSMHRELVLLTAFLYLIFAGLGSDDDDDEDVSGFRKYAQKALEKYKNEFSFYYSPTEFTKMLKNPVPLVGFMEDCERFLTQGIGQVYNFSTGDEEGMESNKPAKYFFRVLPITKEGLNFYALYDDEFRKEWGIK